MNKGCDIALVLDTTGTMGTFVNELRRRLDEVAAAAPRARVAVTCFKDHGDEGTYLLLEKGFTRSWGEVREFLASPAIAPGRGGGGAEAVECALHAATELPWRLHARKSIVLVGDKPPHGAGLDGLDACPCGIDYRDEIAALAARGVRVHTVAVGEQLETRRVFEWMSFVTGGTALELRSVKDVASVIASLARDESPVGVM